MLGDDDVCRARPHRAPGRGLRPPSRHRRGPRRGVDHRRPGRAARHVAQPGPRAPRAAAPSGARAQHARRPIAHGPPPRLRGRRRLQQRLPPRPGLRLLGARRARASASATCPAGRSSACAATATTSPTSPPRRSRSQEVQNALRSLIDAAPLRELVPELDWGVMHPDAAERRALEVLADALERRVLPLPGLASELRAPRRARARRAAPAPQRPQDRPDLVRLQRLRAAARPSRAWRPRSSRAAAGTSPSSTPPTRPDPSGLPYAVREWDEDGIHLVGIHNRQHGLWDLGNPLRELDDPPITQAFARAAGPRAPRRRALPQPAQPRRRAHRRGRRARPAELLLDPQLLAHLPARLPAHRRRRDLRRPRRPRPRLRLVRRRPARHRRPPAAPGGHPRPLHARRLGVPRRLRRDALAPSPARTTRPT